MVGIAAGIRHKEHPGLAQWLPQVDKVVNVDTVISLLARMPRATAQRAAYLSGPQATTMLASR